nr:retrovirus-related Pol polyprotein from transposon TNT 1-94 [Tanacetum cinerariifolium]
VEKTNDLSNLVTSNSIPTTIESKVIENDKVIALGMFRINPFKNSREEKSLPDKPINASVRTNPITVPQPYVITKKFVNSESNGFFSTGVDIDTKAKRPQPMSNTKNNRVPFASKSSLFKNKEVEVIQICLWCVDSGCSKHMTGNLKLLINFVWKFLGTVWFGNDHVAAILGFGDLQWGNILISRVYFIEGLGENLFLVGQFCDSDLEVAFRRNTYFVRNLKGVELLKGNRITNLYTINLHDIASSSLIFLMARATYTKSWLWHQRLSHLNFDIINDLARNDFVIGLPNFKYHKEHLFPSCEQGKSKRVSHPPKSVPNSKQRLHLLHMDLCGPMRIISINGKRLKLEIQSMTSGQISTGLDLPYAPSTITTQKPTKGELDLLFEAMYDDYVGGQPSATSRTILAAQAPQVLHTPMTTTTTTDTAPTPTNSSSQATSTIDPTLFIRSFDNDIFMVQVYVDDIIFGSTHPRLSQPRSTLRRLKGSFIISKEPLIRVSSIRMILDLNYPDFHMLIMRDVKTPSSVLLVKLNSLAKVG